MLQVRKANERGHAQFDWLNSFHTFSFGDYHDPKQMGWGPLRVINDDTVAAGEGFPKHPHSNMEIISYVLEGALAHEDTIGTGSVIRPGDVQMMEAGTGIAHSEFNNSDKEPVHFLQIWVVPNRSGAPSYQQRHYSEDEKRGKFRVVVSPDGRDESLSIRQDVSLYSALIDGDESIEWKLDLARPAYVHIARGTVTLNGMGLGAGDGVRIAGESSLKFENGSDAEVLLFDLPPQ
jgi:redox-sensitive bicupin YhaK (pirin superfamily)